MADLSITPGSVKKVAGYTQTDRGIAGVTVTAGQPIYRDTTNADKMALCDADTESASVCAGVALHAALADQPIEFAVADVYEAGATLTVGQVYVVSTTAGSIAPYSDLASGDYVTILGVAKTTARLELRINSSKTAKA